MPRIRPYFNCSAKDLDRLVEENESNPAALSDLLNEISLRKKSEVKLRQTSERAKTYLSKIKTRAPGDERSAVLCKLVGKEKCPSDAPSTSVELNAEESPEIGSMECQRQKRSGDLSWTGTRRIFEVTSRRSLLDRLFSSYPLSFEASDDFLTIKLGSTGQEAVISRPEINWSLSKGWFFSRFRFSQNGVVMLEGRTRRHQSDEIESFLYEWVYRDRIAEATAAIDSLHEGNQYINHRKVRAWHQTYASLLEMADAFPSCSPFLSEFRALAREFESRILEANQRFVESEIESWRSYFGRVEKQPLTFQQMRTIVSDADSCLAIAGAGTGKTSTVVGKIGYLVESGVCNAENILALTFARDAAQELRGRVKERLGFQVEVKTFHSLGMELLEKHWGSKLKISEAVADERAFLALVHGIVRDVTREGVGKQLLLDFVSKHRYPARYLEDFDSQGKYFDYLRKTEPRTLRGELVKSFEELLIADWLCLNGIKYEYERPYEIQTSSLRRRQYRPDFYLSDYGIYLEHFGINRSGETAPGINAKSYLESMEWKRSLHKQQGTILVETFSWERMEGIIHDQLRSKLEIVGVEIKPFDVESIQELLATAKIDKKIVSLLRDFLKAYKANQYTKDELCSAIDNSSSFDRERFKCFFRLFELVFDRYTAHLKERQEIDFEDLILEATLALESEKASLPFCRVIVDEYQDISRGRFRFLKAILGCNADSRILAVGDDWQSIYGFTGSDVRKTTLFEDFFDGAIRIPLDKTFRFNDKIHEISSSFVMRNPSQIRKEILASKSRVKDPVCFVDRSKCADRGPVRASLDEVMKRKPSKEKWSVFLLGRYSFCKPEDLDEIRASYPDFEIEFKTVHSSKGLEADAVVLVDLVTGRYGFPSKVESDPIQSLVLPGSEDYEDAEERRLLYVAMTRARHCVVVMGDETKPSPFWTELLQLAGQESVSSGSFTCPVCGEGIFVQKSPNKSKGYAWECSLSPYCSGVAKTCGQCGTSPLFENGCLLKSCKVTKDRQVKGGKR
jgi:DNA helicase-4